MKSPMAIWFFISLIILVSCSFQSLANVDIRFQKCMINNSQNKSFVSNDIYTSNNSSYLSILRSQIKNTRFNTSETTKPLIIVTPREDLEVQLVVHCAKELGLQVRVRGGGHDYEGLSYTSHFDEPFLVIDLINFNNVTVNLEEKTAWVGGGSTIGELYFRVSEKTKNLGFPTGTCHSVGVGGHISGGGFGTLARKYGLAADNVIDARLVDANGRILDRKGMGEEYFWAIRGGGGNTFGVILAWKVQLVDVPETVTVFNVPKTLEQNATNLVHKWQTIALNLPRELFIRVGIFKQNTIPIATFTSLFLGSSDELLPILQNSFPELGVTKGDLIELSWIESVLFIDGFVRGRPPSALLDNVVNNGIPFYYKAKSDFVKKPIPLKGLEGIWDFFRGEDLGLIILSPYGGRMSEISESSIAFPHRDGNLFMIEHWVNWSEQGDEASKRHINWIRRLYDYFTPFVSKNPREAYINYRDLDIGANDNNGNANYSQARVWGIKYFKNNFDRLVRVKTKIDPNNFFRNEQSIPPLVTTAYSPSPSKF